MAEPKIYTKNYVDASATILPSHGSTNINRIYDADRDAQYQSSGANDDTTEVTIEIQFFEAGVSLSKTIDRLIVVNHNLKDIELEYWNGSAWASAVTDTVIAVSTSTLSFTAVTTTKVKLKATETQVADEEKLIGLLVVCALQLDVGVELSQYGIKYRQKNSQLVLGDGALHRTVVMHSAFRSDKYGARITFKYLSDAQFELFRAIKEAGEAFLVQLESTNKPEDIYFVHWVSPLSWAYASRYKGAGKNLTIEVKEV